MSKMVSARIPDAVFDQVCSELKERGSSPSELINSAFEFFLREKKLPKTAQPKPADRRLSKEQAEKLKCFFSNSILDVDISDDPQEDKRIAREAKAEKHEALA